MKNQAFTLIELLVVVLIIGILAAIAVPQYQKTVAKSRFMQCMVLARAFSEAEERFYLSEGKYTADITKLDINLGPYQVLSTSGNDYASYEMENGYSVALVINGYGGYADRVDTGGNVFFGGITYYLKNPSPTVPHQEFKGLRTCAGKEKTYQEACMSLGGVYSHTSGSGTKHYILK